MAPFYQRNFPIKIHLKNPRWNFYQNINFMGSLRHGEISRSQKKKKRKNKSRSEMIPTKKLKRLSVGWIPFALWLSSLHIKSVNATTPVTELPPCYVADPETGITADALCAKSANENDKFADKSHCIYNGSVYVSGSVKCATPEGISSPTDYIIKCTESNTCTKVTITTDDIKAADELLFYHYECNNNNVCTWSKKTNYYYYNTKFIYCASAGNCALVSNVGYYINPGSDASTYPILSVPSKGAVNAIAKDSAQGKFFVDGKTIVDASATPPTYKNLITCTDAETPVCTSDTASVLGFLLNGGVTSGAKLTNALIQCYASGSSKICKQLNGSASNYYLNGGSDKADNPLIYCANDNNGCSKSAATVGYYLDGSSPVGTSTTEFSKLINCSGEKSCSSLAIDSTKLGYYIDAADTTNTKIIYCENVSGTIKCSSRAHEAQANAPKHYLDAATKRVITCVNDGPCTLEDASIKGYFINSGKTNSLIKCNGSSCEVVTASNKKAGGYSIVISSPAGIYLCLTDKCTADTERVEIKINDSGTASYHSITVAKNVFPGVSKDSVIPVKVDKDGSAFLLEAASLPTCSSTANPGPCKVGGKPLGNGVHCISSNKIYYVGDSGNCGLVTNAQAEDKVFYFGPDNKAVTNPTENNSVVSIAYICTFTGEAPALESCKIAKGYTYSSSKQVICSGWKKDTCTVISPIPTSCDGLSDGSLTSLKMCISRTEKYTLPTSAGTSYAAYNTTDISSIYGKNKNEIVFLGITYKGSAVESAIVVPNKKGYFVNLSVSGTTKDAIINCKEANNLAKCVVEDAKIGYYLHGDDTDKLIKCSVSGCVEVSIDSSNLGYYINATKKTDLINCAGTAVTCSSKVHKGTGTAQVHYLGAGGTVITCTKEGCIEEDASIKGYFINAATTDDSDKIIACSGTGATPCVSGTAASGCAKAGNFIIDGSNVSICTVAGDEAPVKLESSDSGETVFKSIAIAGADDDAITAGYHKNVNAEGTKENALIQCGTEKTLNSCKSLNALNGYYLNAATDKAQNQIIKCSGTGCAVDKVSATTCGKAGTLIKDKDNTTTIKLCKVDAAKDDDIIAIPASATTYETLTVKANNFPNATTDDSGKCSLVPGSSEKETFYFNSKYESVAAGVGANIAYQCTFDDNGAVKSCELVKGYIKQGDSFLQCNGWKEEVCAAPSTTACANDMNGEMEITNKSICFTTSVTLTGESKIAFELTKTSNIYGEKEGDVVVLSLSATEAVVTTLDTENTRYFVNQNTAEDKEIIKCGGDGCTSEPKKIGFYLEGGSEEKVSDTVVYSKLISCGDTSCTAAAPTAVGYYVDASSAKEEKGKDEEDNEIILTTYEKLILCEKDENDHIKCKSVASVASGYYLNAKPDGFTDALIKCSGTDSMTCKLYKVENENSIYINNADKGIIQCVSDTAGCAGVDADTKEALYGTEKIPFYYVNSDDTVTDSTRIIKCIGVGQCAVMPAAPNDVFLNGNLKSNDNTKGEENVPLILCSEEGCAVGVSGPKNAGTEYYINSGVNEGDGGEVNPIIKCDSDGTTVTCEAAPAPGTSETFFINGNYENDKKYLLKCKSNECEGYGEAKAEGIENYIHGAATDLTDAIIECTLTEDPDNEGEFLASCAFPATAPEAGNVYLNSFNQNLIQCTDSECTDFDKVDDTVNVNGDDTNRLIICSESKCEPTNNDSVGEGKSVYYVNAGIVPSNATPYKNALIQCGSSEACNLVDAGEDFLYVNSNTIDSDNFLIYCNAGQCEPISGAPEGDESEFYINFGTTSTDKLIECTGDGCEVKDLSDLITDTVTEFLVKNKNYGEDNDPVNYLIRCTAEDCVPYGTENPVAGAVEYYVNHAQSDLSDAVIKIEFSDGAGTGRKRGTGVTASISYVEDIEENDIFLNSSTQKLIQCSDEKCEAFESTGSANIPAYYINAAAVKNDDFNDFIIKCTDEKCSIENGHANDVYLNANLQDTENSETGVKNTVSTDTEHPLIICSEGECTPEKSDVEGEEVEFFINSGEYNDGTDDYALIKCTGGEPATCQSEKVTLAEGVSEVFYKNANYGSDRDAINYLIGCSSTTTCTPTRNSEAAVGTEHYVHGAAEALTNAIIECTLSAATRRRGEGEEEGDDTEDTQEQAPNLTATCSIIETAKPGNVYIDSSKPVQVIPGMATASFIRKYTRRQRRMYCNRAPCKKDDTNPHDNGIFCTNGGKIYLNTITTEASGDDPATGTCVEQSTNQYYIFECSSTSYSLASDYTGSSYLVYQYDSTASTTLVQNPSEYLYDSTHNILLYCATTNAAGTCTSVTKDGYYVNPDTDTTKSFADYPLLLYASEASPPITPIAKATVVAANEFYVDGSSKVDTTDLKYTQLISCTLNADGDGITQWATPASSCSSISNYVTGFYLNKAVTGTGTSALISCTAGTSCSIANGNGYYENTADTTKIIKCTTSDGCDNNTAGANNNVYIDASSEYESNTGQFGKLIKCVKDENEAVQCTSNDLTAGYYIDESSKNDDDVYEKLIKCDSYCETITASTNGEGYYVDEIHNNGSDKYTQLIVCSASSCESKYADGFYLNKDVTDSPNNAIISCSDNLCEKKNGKDGGYCENTADTTKIIKCTGTGCDNNTAGAKNNVYIDASSEDENNQNQFGKLIKCVEATVEDITVVQCTSNDLTAGYYIDESSKNDSNTYDNIIKCTTYCESITVTAEHDGYYGDEMFNPPKQDGTPSYIKLILCTTSETPASSSCSSIDDFVTGYYINKGVANTNENAIISCSDVSCGIINGIEGFYLDGSDTGTVTDDEGNKTTTYNRLINCSGEGSILCSPHDDLRDGYYLDAGNIETNDDAVTYKGIIKCTKNDSGSITCVADSTVADGFYLDASKDISLTNTDESSRQYSRLIRCTEAESAITCALEDPKNGNISLNKIIINNNNE
ncbi:hypothetical protein PIROE2DRAFT_60823 [Piromyces sp. E2]|nr:hypothetical protein PIROE2DRAFT_60823 [Piromyces sp. E2]|eukprot:OUM64188.1 hypothetical protein PIROE2DRAFT_60823 [Piromyces sp. E2]